MKVKSVKRTPSYFNFVYQIYNKDPMTCVVCFYRKCNEYSMKFVFLIKSVTSTRSMKCCCFFFTKSVKVLNVMCLFLLRVWRVLKDMRVLTMSITRTESYWHVFLLNKSESSTKWCVIFLQIVFRLLNGIFCFIKSVTSIQ